MGVFLARAGFAVEANAADEFDLARLKNGEVLLQNIHTDKPGGAARVTALFHGTAEAVWSVIGDCKNEYIYLRGLILCEVLKPGTDHMLVHHRLRNSWYAPVQDYTFEVERKVGHLGEAHLVNGDLKVLEGRWRMVPLEDQSYVIVIHEIRIQPQLPAPRWMVRHSLRKDLPDMLACIRGLAAASGDRGRILSDLGRCPGKVPDEVRIDILSD